MGMSCCKCEEQHKEKEMVIPKKIKYNFYEINKNRNLNDDNILSNSNEQDLMSNNSQGFEVDKRYDSIDSSSYNNSRFNKNSSSRKSPFLGQIKEKGEEEQEDKDNNNRGLNELERINLNKIINNIDKIYKDKDNNNNELKRMDIDNNNKMNNYNIDNESQRKVN